MSSRDIDTKIDELLDVISIDELLSILSNEYDEKNYITLTDELLKTSIEETSFFNYKGRQSSVFNRFKDNDINTIADLFRKYDSGIFNYGCNELHDNRFIHNEIDGIVNLLKFRYLGARCQSYDEILNEKVNMNIYLSYVGTSPMYSGNIYRTVCYYEDYLTKCHVDEIIKLYRLLKSCGFDHAATKTLIDIAYESKVENITVGEFLLTVPIDVLSSKLEKTQRELIPCLKILKEIRRYYRQFVINNNDNKSVK